MDRHSTNYSAQRWSRSEKWSVKILRYTFLLLIVLNAGRDLRNGRTPGRREPADPCCAQRWSRSEKWSAKNPPVFVFFSSGAQRWSRSEKWSDLIPDLPIDLVVVLNAGRDLRNGRLRSSSFFAIRSCAQRWSRSEKWSAPSFGSLSLLVNRAQRWSRSEKWSAPHDLPLSVCGRVLNAGRDLRNGRLWL